MKYTLGIVKLDPYLINREFSDPKDIYEADERYERIPHKFLVTEDSDFLWFYADKCISHEILKERLGLERVLGGGCLSIDPKLKALVLDNYSGDFGAVPKPVLEKFGKLLLVRFPQCNNVIANPFEPKIRKVMLMSI